MDTTFKFGDKVALKRSPNACGIVARVYIDKVTVLWEDEYYGMSTDPIEDVIPYVYTNTSNIQKVMDALGIKKDVPIDVYDKDTDEKDKYSPYTFNGNDFVNNKNDVRRGILADIVTGYSYFLPHNSFPQLGDIYYYICPNGTIMHRNWDGLSYDYATKLMGNVFESEVEAKCHVTEMLAKYREVM